MSSQPSETGPKSLRIGFFTGSAGQVGSGQGMVLPLARALARQGHQPFAIHVTRFARRTRGANGIVSHSEPLLSSAAERPLCALEAALSKVRSSLWASCQDGKPSVAYHLLVGRAQLSAATRLKLDVLYTFHNTNVVGVLYADMPPHLVYAINLVGFGIDPSRGGAMDTFPFQRTIFERPRWDLHVTASESEYREYQAVYRQLGLPDDRLLMLPHSYDVELFHPSPQLERQQLKRRFAVDTHDLVLVYPVNVYRRKNIEMAIDIVAALKPRRNAVLIVPGSIVEPAYHGYLLQKMNDLGVANDVILMDGVSYSGMIEIYNAADVTIFPSHQETFGLGLIESLGCGTPVVGPRWIRPCAELLAGATGACLADKTVDDFVAKVLDMVAGAGAQRTSIADHAKSQFGSDSVGRRFAAAVERLHARKVGWRTALASIDWKALYRDQGALL